MMRAKDKLKNTLSTSKILFQKLRDQSVKELSKHAPDIS
jgi:hypothetical protein